MPPDQPDPWLPPLWLWPLFGAIQIGLAVFYLVNETPILIVSAVSLLGLAVLSQVATVRRRRERNVIPGSAEAGG